MSTKAYNPFKVGDVEIPAPVVFQVLMGWKGMPGSPVKVPILDNPLPPKGFDVMARHTPNYVICLGCMRIAGWMDGGHILRQCSKCYHERAYPMDFWSRIGAYSAHMTPWAITPVVVAVIGTVLDFNQGKVKLPSGAFKNERTK